MKRVLSVWLSALAFVSPLQAKETPASLRHPEARQTVVTLLSPDANRTWAWGTLKHVDFEIEQEQGKPVFAVVLTYSNELLSDNDHPRTTEDFRFRFPALRADAARHIFWRSPSTGSSYLLACPDVRGAFGPEGNVGITVFDFGGKLLVALRVYPPGSILAEPVAEIRRGAPWTLQSLISPQ